MVETVKTCTKCRRDLPTSSFSKANWIASGLRSDCKECYSVGKRAARIANPISEAASRRQENVRLRKMGQSRCKSCSQIKLLPEFPYFPARGYHDTTCRECVRLNVKRWTKANRERATVNAVARCAKRYADKRDRTPLWLTREQREQIVAVYAEARRISRETGVPHHVDHIYPLVGRDSCGLHVPWNLQVLTASENVKKSNKAPA